MTEQTNEIDLRAAEWAAAAESESFSDEQAAALQVWLAEDTRHFGAFVRMQAVLARVERVGPAVREQEIAHPAVLPLDAARHSRRRMVLTGSVAACLALVVATGAWWQSQSSTMSLETSIGQNKVVTLPDGSTVTLNTGSKLTVHYTALERDVTVSQGEALFDVAKNKLRPFIVISGSNQARAVGTSFMVTSLPDQPYTVTVREGTVAVSNHGQPVLVHAGSRAIGEADGRFAVESLTAAQVENALAWREGRIFFRNQTLASAVHELARYSTTRILIDDPSAAARTVTGMYVSNDPKGFAQAISVALDLNIAVGAGAIHLMSKRTAERGK